MADNTPKYEYFNTSVRAWAREIKNGMVRRAKNDLQHQSKDWKKRTAPKLADSIAVGFRKSYGTISTVRWSFSRHGIFVHYGVGNGWIRSGNGVRRGRKYTREETEQFRKRGYTAREVRKMRYVYHEKEATGRKAVDWFDVEIRNGMKWLTEYVGDFYGDVAMNAMLEQLEKPLSTFTQQVKVRIKKQS
jgi:hypothetical protein